MLRRCASVPEVSGTRESGGCARWILLLALAGCAHATGSLPVAVARGLDGRSEAIARPGKVVLVDFWATWCAPCKVALPLYRDLYLDLRARGFEVVAVSVDNGDEEVRAFLQREPLPFTVLRDPGGVLAESLGVTQMPTSFLLGRDGRTRARLDGFEPGAEPALRKQIEALLAERPP
jgi:peroxiredoxin